MKCLRCNIHMNTTVRSGIEIDYCPNCHGVWLDEGELKKIIEKVGEYYSDKKNYEADYEKYGYGDKDYYIHHPNRHKKSYINSFFDFY